MSANEMDAVVARLTATLDAHDAVARGEGAPDGTTFPILASKADLRALLAQLEAAKRDSARLDWLEAQGNGDQWIARVSANGRGFRLHNTVGQPNKSPTARAAIDAARSSTGGPDNAD